MAARLIAENAGVTRASYALPNKHYVPVDMKYLGVENVSPPCVQVVAFSQSETDDATRSAKAEVFCPLLAPRYGSILNDVFQLGLMGFATVGSSPLRRRGRELRQYIAQLWSNKGEQHVVWKSKSEAAVRVSGTSRETKQ